MQVSNKREAGRDVRQTGGGHVTTEVENILPATEAGGMKNSFSLHAPEAGWPADTSISNFWPPELSE